MTEIAALMSKDHDRLDAIFADFRKSGGGRALMQLFSQFESGLRAHMTWEEEILFPAVEQRTGTKDSGSTTAMRAEHERIKQLLQSLRDEIDRGCQRIHMPVPETGSVQTITAYTFDRAAMNKSAKNLMEVLVPHRQKEGGALYVSLEGTLTEAERVALIDQIHAARPAATDHPER